MLRQVLAVIGGFLLWSVLWLLLGLALAAGGWLPAAAEPVTAWLPLVVLLLGSIVSSLLSGFAAAAIARTSGYRVAIAVGLLLLVVGITVQAQNWQLMPVWYHAAFLICLVPACIVGANFRARTARA